jgi:hypothetical protein
MFAADHGYASEARACEVSSMWQPNNFQWWTLVVFSLLIVAAWPPGDGKSLGAKFVNWAVDPQNELPTLPDQLALGHGDDPDAVNARDMQVQQYDALYIKGGWTRKRLELKVAGDPFDPATERQLLTVAAMMLALVVWRLGARRSE